MRWLVFLGFAFGLGAQTSLTLAPAVVTHCAPDGLGRVTATWIYSGAGPVQVRVNTASGPSFTGPVGPQGSSSTGDWVRDGMVFVLTDAGTQELARASAQVQCNPTGEVLAAGLAGADYFPLQVGDEWVYAMNSRQITNGYLDRRISGAEIIGGTTWFVIEDTVSGEGNPVVSHFRNDSQGRIYQLTDQGEQLWLDPTAPGILKAVGRSFEIKTPIGTLYDVLNYESPQGLILETGMLVRGVGLLSSSDQMLSGSSGGFTQSLNLVHANIDGHIYYASPSNSIELGVEANDFDVTNKKAANCAVPCYFVACNLVPGTDPPGTYKPCFQARVRCATGSVDLDLLDGSSNSVFHTTLNGPMFFSQVPLYSAPNQPFPVGSYQLRVKAADGGTALTPIQLH